jgi:hypothetical protein
MKRRILAKDWDTWCEINIDLSTKDIEDLINSDLAISYRNDESCSIMDEKGEGVSFHYYDPEGWRLVSYDEGGQYGVGYIASCMSKGPTFAFLKRMILQMKQNVNKQLTLF